MDREKVIKSLKWFRDRDKWREGIMIHDDHAEVRKQICDNAIELLKEQETANVYKCPNCGTWVSAENVVRCKNCKHRPKEPNLETYESGFDLEFPEGSKCPCRCGGDEWYSWYPDDEWFCADGERRTDDA